MQRSIKKFDTPEDFCNAYNNGEIENNYAISISSIIIGKDNLGRDKPITLYGNRLERNNKDIVPEPILGQGILGIFKL